MAVTPDVHIWLWPWFNGLCSLLCVMYVYFHVFFNWINSSQLVYGEGERERTWAVSLWPQNGYTSVWLSREIDLDTLKMNHEWWSPDSKGRSWNIKSKMWVPIGLLNNLFITLFFNKTNFFLYSFLNKFLLYRSQPRKQLERGQSFLDHEDLVS